MADFKLDALLEIDDSEIEDVNDELEASVEAEDGAAQQDGGGLFTPMNIIIGLLTAVLGQLKAVQGIMSGVFRIINLALLPVIAAISGLLQPVADFVLNTIGEGLDFGIARTFQQAASKFVSDLTTTINSFISDMRSAISEIPGVDITSNEQTVSESQTATGISTVTDAGSTTGFTQSGGQAGQFAAEQILEFAQNQIPDMQDEDKKDNFASFVSEALDELPT